MEIITRRDAKGVGDRHYFTGKKCKNGHIAIRLVCDGSCRECTRIKSLKRRQADPEPSRQAVKKWARANIDKVKAKEALRWAENPEKERVRAKVYREHNAEKVKIARRVAYKKFRIQEQAASKKWKSENRPRLTALQKHRECCKMKRAPMWLTGDDKEEIVKLYEERARLTELTGIMFHVDHVIPLQGEMVSGLHVPLNLQVLTAFENQSKNNRFYID